VFPEVPPAVDRPAPGTSLDRAAEVMRAAKQIVDWVRSTTIMEDLGFPSKVSVDLDNSREFTLTSGYGSKNKCRARPKGADQCRGDAPKFACVDEIAFCEQQWYVVDGCPEPPPHTHTLPPRARAVAAAADGRWPGPAAANCPSIHRRRRPAYAAVPLQGTCAS